MTSEHGNQQSRPNTDGLLRPYMPELDVVRGIAILLVLAYHGMAPPITTEKMSTLGTVLFSFAQRGWIGVNLFFVLSGFLITGILLDRRQQPNYYSRFYIRRALRILPALYLVLLLLRSDSLVSWPFVGLASLFLANCASLLGSTLQYGPLWSLAVEEHFYLLWPTVIRKFSNRALIGILLFICATTPIARSFFLQPDQVVESLYSWFNLDGLSWGALLAFWLRAPRPRRVSLEMFAGLAVAAGGTSFVLASRDPLSKNALQVAGINMAAAGFLMAMILLATSRWKTIVDRPALRLCGFVSYSLYLVHVVIFRLIDQLLGVSGLWKLPLTPTGLMLTRFALGTGFALLIAYLSRKSVEEFFLNLAPNYISRLEKGVAVASISDVLDPEPS